MTNSKKVQAERVAIETYLVHFLEDRGLIKQKEEELDEEDKYSKVIKNKNNNKKDDI